MALEDEWARAVEDAGYQPDDVALIPSDHEIANPTDVKVAYFPPDVGPEPSPFPLSEAEVTAVEAAFGRHRVAIPRALEARVQLGGMRWALECARQFDQNPGLGFFTDAVNNSLHPAYGAAGMGGAVVWHSIPSVRDADSAAGHLVTRTLGPQYGDLWTENGALFRADQPVPDTATLGLRLVIFAAIHAEALERWSSQQGIDLEELLCRVDPNGPGWWSALLDDADFTHLRMSARYYVPSPQDIAVAGVNAASAWRPLQRHFDLTVARGRTVLGI